MVSRIGFIFFIFIIQFIFPGNFAIGAILSAVFIILEFLFSKYTQINILSLFVLISIMIFSTVFSGFFGYIVDIQESYIYLIAISFLFLTGLLIGNYFIKIDHRNFFHIYKLSWIIISFPLIGKLFPSLNLCQRCNSPVFIFHEPSHYVIYFSIFIFFNLLTKYRFWKFQFLISFLSLCFLYKSLLGVLVLILIINYYLFLKLKKSFFILFFISLISFLGFLLSSSLLFVQFQERLTFDNSNLTVLTFLNGIENLVYSLKNYLPSGVGLGNMGLIEFPLEINKAFEILNEKILNIYDGSFVFSKIITEMGLFGLLISILILRICYQSHNNFLMAIKIANQDIIIKSGISLSLSFSILIQSLLRGGGTISLYTTMVGIIYVINKSVKANLS